MKTKHTLLAGLLLIGLLGPSTVTAQITLTGGKLIGLRADGTPDGSGWDTAEAGALWGLYFFTGSARSPRFLNGGQTDDSLNPKYELPPGTYTVGFACESAPSAGVTLELAFNNKTETRISVTTMEGGNGRFSGTTTFTDGDCTVTLTEIQLFSPKVDLVGAHATQPSGTPDTAGTFTLVVSRRQSMPPGGVTLNDFHLAGDLQADRADFTLTGTAIVENAKGGTLELISGTLALTEVGAHPQWHLRAEPGRYVAEFSKAGKYPIQLKFAVAVRESGNWNSLDFRVAPSPVQPIVLNGLSEDTQFEFPGAARPAWQTNHFLSYLPADGTVKLAWQEARKAEEGKLFFAAEMQSQVSVSPGLLRQVALMDFKVMQGEINRVTLLLHGSGEVTRVQGNQVLSWKLEPAENSGDRRLVVQLNQPQKESFGLQVHLQTPLGAFPQTARVTGLAPEGATRFAGYYRIVNEGAVRLEVAEAKGLSQISPEQFPESDATRSLLRPTGSQRFAYRFSSADYTLNIQADQIQPELSVSEVLTYHHGENDLAIEAELELDVREAPLRELLLRIPKGYVIARITASGMSDYFVSDTKAATTDARPRETTPDSDESRLTPAAADQGELRIVYGQPVSGRQLVNLRLERNQPLSATNWILPRVEVVKAKSVRGNVGVSADAGFRLSTDRTQGLTEIATAFFPRKAANLQAAFRLSDPGWSATLRVERLPQTVQVDGFHLFSISEGVAYGSSVMNYLVSGAPVSAFRVELSDEYFNVEFTGKDVRNWTRTTNGYLVQLHSSVGGAYTLLATYERPFKSQGETLTFTGARPLDAQSEQGHTIVVSAYQFQVKPVAVSPTLLALEPGEVPADYRLFFDAPILAAYRYTARPFDLKLELSPLAQGDSLNQVVDRATLTTRISKEGQILTDVSYFVKNRGNPNFRLTLPAEMQLWSASVNGTSVVPVKDDDANLIPLPQRADPNSVLRLDLKLASKSANAERVKVTAPSVNAPVMLAEWKLEPDAGQRLEFIQGSISPIGGIPDHSGFAQLNRMLHSGTRGGSPVLTAAATATIMLLLALGFWRWASSGGATKATARHIGGFVLGLVAFAAAGILIAELFKLAAEHRSYPATDVAFLAPVQQSASALTVEVRNVAASTAIFSPVGSIVLAVGGLIFFAAGGVASAGFKRAVATTVGWTLLAWAALRLPNGAPWFLGVLCAFILVQMLIPALRRWAALPEKSTQPESRDAAAATALLLAFLAGMGTGCSSVTPTGPVAGSSVEAVEQEVRAAEGFVAATATIRWSAQAGETLPVLTEPAVLTGIQYPEDTLSLVQSTANGKTAQELTARRSGVFSIKVSYQLAITQRDQESGFVLPTPHGLVNRLKLVVTGSDVDVLSPQAVAVQRAMEVTNTTAALVLSPAAHAWVGWKPRSRDVKSEKAVFYAELTQLYVPAAGVIEGAHVLSIRPAQGELSELTLTVPRGATITDVTEGGKAGSLISLWRFDPDARKLRISFARPQSRPFALLVRSQMATGPLPFEQGIGLLAVENAANQIGMLGIATGGEVQLESVETERLAAINLEDFPAQAAQILTAQIPGLTVRRAYRYSDREATANVSAAPVEPDVRVDSQDTVSLGEDRVVLASTANVDITRAGIFKLSFVLPEGFDVESLSGAALSHWTESRGPTGRIITLNLRGKTEGRQQFVISLTGSGIKATGKVTGWTVPRLLFREASKQRGTLLVVPEQGMQLQAGTMDGLSQLDPQQAGIRQKGVLAFRVLQAPWNLALDIEQVAAWVQVTSLQHVVVSEALMKVAANLNYQIENTGLKSLRVALPVDADSVRFTGQHFSDSDFQRVPGDVTNGLQGWEIKLQRRVVGPFALQVNYQILIPEQAAEAVLRGVQAKDVNLQRGYVTLQAGGRVQVTTQTPGEALQATEWQSIPRTLRQNVKADSANFAFRLAEPDFDLRLTLQRHDAVKLLPARVHQVALNSVISDAGVMLTQVRLEMSPGDKRLLSVTLPPNAHYWFAFVNQNGVWPWRQGDAILIPLEQQSREDRPVPVEIFYSSEVGKNGSRALDLELFAPKFDLPLENITWQVHLNDKWKLNDWSGTLQFQQQQMMPVAAQLDLGSYLAEEASQQREKTQEAEQMLALGNSALERGDPQQARRAFQSAFGLSTHDYAFNEDARVQLHNLKLQQALVGLNVRQAATAGETGALAGRLRELRAGKDANYTQADAKQIIDANTTEDNTAYMKLAEKLVQQQDAAVTSATAIRANIPEEGRTLTFQRAVVVDREADLHIGLDMATVRAAGFGTKFSLLLGTLLGIGVLSWGARRLRA